MPFAACPCCSQQNFLKVEAAGTLRCSRCGQIYWVKPARPPASAIAAAAEARSGLRAGRGSAQAA